MPSVERAAQIVADPDVLRQVLLAVDKAWREQRGEVERVGANVGEALRRASELVPSADALSDDILAAAMPRLHAVHDGTWGG